MVERDTGPLRMKRPLQVGSIARVDYQSYMTTALLVFVLCLLKHLPIITPESSCDKEALLLVCWGQEHGGWGSVNYPTGYTRSQTQSRV